VSFRSSGRTATPDLDGDPGRSPTPPVVEPGWVSGVRVGAWREEVSLVADPSWACVLKLSVDELELDVPEGLVVWVKSLSALLTLSAMVVIAGARRLFNTRDSEK